MSTLKNRIAYRCKLIEGAVRDLIDSLNSLELATDSTHHDSLKERLDRHLNKNVLQKIEALYAKIKNVQDEAIDRSVSDQIRWVRNYIQRLIEQRIKARKCKKGSNHYEYLLLPAKETILRKLTEIAQLASLLHQLPEEIQEDTDITEQALVLQKQQELAEQSEEFQVALKESCVWARKQKAEVSVFISYAWPSDQRPWEAWVQPFLQALKQHLETAGVLVYLDLYDSRYGFNSYHYMEEIDACSYVILIGTESLLDKFNRGVSSVCNELNRIRRRREQDVLDRVFSVIPLVVSGTLCTALPAEFERFTVVENFLGGSYIQVIKELLAKLYSVSPDFPDFANAWKFYSGSTLQPVQSVFSTVQAEEFVVADVEVIHRSSKTYIEELRRIHQDTAFSGVQCLFDNEVVSIEDCYVNLALIKEEEQKRKESLSSNNLKEQDEAMELLSSAEQFFTVQEAIKLEDIFNATEQAQQTISHTNRVLITGRAGVGKSTLCQFIVNQWAQNKLWQDRYQGIFRIPLRNLVNTNYTANREYALIEIINRECFADRLSDAEQKQLDVDLKNHPEKFLIILDGYDELSTQAEDQYLVKQVERLMQYPEVIITSRPQYVSSFAASKKLEIIGFSAENIERYVDSFFKNNKEQAISLKQQLEAQALLKSLSHVPLNLELICSAWQKNNWQAGVSLTQLYQNLVYWLQYRYLKKFHQDYNSSSKQQILDDLTSGQIEDLCSEWLTNLEKIAWEMRQTGLIYIHKSRLWAGSHKQLRDSGLLRLTSDKQFYYFAHLTLQEFFAARCVARIIQNVGSQGNAEYEAFQTFFKGNKFNPKLQVVWWFVAGLLKTDKKSLDIYFNLLIQEPRDITMVNELPLFIHCLEQSNLAGESGIGKIILDKVTEQVLALLLNEKIHYEFTDVIINLITQLKLCPQFFNKKLYLRLLDVSKSSDKNVKAIEALGQLGINAMPEQLIEMVSVLLAKLDNYYLKNAAARALGHIGAKLPFEQLDKITLALLLKLHDLDPVLYAVPYAFDQLGKNLSRDNLEKIIGKLFLYLEKCHAIYSIQIISALGLLGRHTSGEQLEKIISLIWTEFKNTDNKFRQRKLIPLLGWLAKKATADQCKKIVSEFLLVLKNSTKDSENARNRKKTIAYLLSSFPLKMEAEQLKEMISEFLLMLKNPHKKIRETAINVLGRCGIYADDEQLTEIIAGFLLTFKEEKFGIRHSAEEAFVALGRQAQLQQFEKIISPLLLGCEDSNFLTKLESFAVLCELIEKMAIEQLTKIISELRRIINSADIKLRKLGVHFLGRFGSQIVHEELVEKIIIALWLKLEDSELEVREKTVEALGELGVNASPKQFAEIVAKLLVRFYAAEEIRDSIISALRYLKVKATSEQLAEIMMALLMMLGSAASINSGSWRSNPNSWVIDALISGRLKNVLIIEKNQLSWFEPKVGKIRVKLPLERLKQLVVIFQKEAESTYSIKSFWLPQALLNKTALMQASQQGNFQLVQSLLNENADTRCVNSQGKLAVHHAGAHSKILKLLIQNHQPIDLIFLENILSALDVYQGDTTNKSADESLLDQLVLSLTGMKNICKEKKEQRKRLLAHLQSFGDSEEQELEGFVPREFLALHIANLLQLLAAIQLGHHDHLLSDYSQTEVISQLKRELLLTVQAAHFEILSNLAKNNQDLQTALAEMIISALSQLSHGEELIYEAGYIKHCIYVAFRRDQDKIIVRVDNLGDGITDHHEQGKTSEGEDGYKPYFIGAYEIGALKNNKVLKNYLVAIMGARELSRTEALPKIYPGTNQQGKLAQEYLDKKWPAKKIQKVGNCVVRSFFVGVHMRLGEELHRLLRSLESNLLTFQEPKQTSQPKKKIAAQSQFFPPSTTAPKANFSSSQNPPSLTKS